MIIINNSITDVTLEGVTFSYKMALRIPARLIAPIGEVFEWDDSRGEYVSTTVPHHTVQAQKDKDGVFSIINDSRKSGMSCPCGCEDE